MFPGKPSKTNSIYCGIAILISVFVQGVYAQSISGFVRELATGEPLPYANVVIKNTYLGAATNLDGYYVIPNIDPGEYEIMVSIIGYEVKTARVKLQASENIRLNFRLAVSAITGEEITVTAERLKFERMVEPSRVTLDTRQIEVLPSFVEADVFRTLQYLPGVQTLNDFSSALYVRGSTPDQNLILLDGITVYNPFHLGGVFSTFNTDAIKEADFHAGGFPARYGGRMGSILNIINREGNTEEFTGKANISLISSKALLEGPLPKWSKVKGSWMLAGRRTYFDKVAEMVMFFAKRNSPALREEGAPDKPFPYYFYDVEGKINFDIGDNHRLTISTFYGDDVFNIDYKDHEGYESIQRDEIYNNDYRSRFDWRWGNRSNSLAWRWIVTPNLIAKTYLAESRFRFRIDLDDRRTGSYITAEDTSRWKDGFFFDAFDKVNDRTLETELTWLTGKGHTVTGGFQHKQLGLTLGMMFATGYLDEMDKYVVDRDTVLWMADRPFEQGFYVQDKWQITPLLSTQLGIRLSRYSQRSAIYFDPRLGLKYFLRDDISLKLNWGRYHQLLTIANPQDENFRFIDIWLAMPRDKKIPYSDHSILGLEYLSPKNILYRAEAYYKDFANLITLKQGQMFTENEGQIKFDPFNEFRETDAYAYGLELLVQKTSGKVTGWVGYTFARTKWKTELHGWYFPKYDRTHTVNLVGDWQWTDITHVGMTISYSTGNPYTPIKGRIEQFQEENSWGRYWWGAREYLVGAKNSARFPPYFRWDISFIRRKPMKNGGHKEWYFQIINLTNHLNTLMYIYREKYDYRTNRTKGVQRFGVPMFPFIPTFGFRIEF